MSNRPFRILGVQQVAIGAVDRGRLHKLWVDTLGLVPVERHTLERENVDEEIVRLGRGAGTVELDLMVPIDPEAKPAVHIPPLNHFGLWVDDLQGAVSHLKAQGVRFAGEIRRGASGHDVAFIHPKGNEHFPIGGEGVLIELVQAPEEIQAALK